MFNHSWPEDINAAQLPKVRDRFQAASMFFDVKLPAHLVIQGLTDRAHRWTSWGSLAAVASVPEVAELELAELGLASGWRASPEYNLLIKDPLFAVLKELRNYETHIEFLGREKSSAGIHMRGFHFAEVRFADLEKLRNVASRRSHVTEDIVNEFNALAQIHTTEEIVHICLDRMASMLRVYVERVTRDTSS